MARIEWIRHRLENWGRWCQLTDSGALGYPKQSAFARMAPSGGSKGDAVPLSSLEASETNEAVKSLQFTQSHLFLALDLTYARALPRHLVARRMGCAESTVAKNLGDADRAIARWLDDRKLAAARMRDANKGFTT